MVAVSTLFALKVLVITETEPRTAPPSCVKFRITKERSAPTVICNGCCVVCRIILVKSADDPPAAANLVSVKKRETRTTARSRNEGFILRFGDRQMRRADRCGRVKINWPVAREAGNLCSQVS